jgi:hypothetical protein
MELSRRFGFSLYLIFFLSFFCSRRPVGDVRAIDRLFPRFA